MAQTSINAIVQAIVALIIAGIAYGVHVILARRSGTERQTFLRWTGLHLPPKPIHGLLYLVGFIVVGFASVWLQRVLQPSFAEMAQNTPQWRIAGFAPGALLVAAPMYAFVQTGFSEELIFRGLLGKRLIAWLGYERGNLIQSLVFALAHVGIARMLLPDNGWMVPIVLGAITGVLAWVSGWAMEKKGGGSIMFPWLMHSGVNLAAIIAYVISPVG